VRILRTPAFKLYHIKSTSNGKLQKMRVLVFGAKGWIGSIFKAATSHTVLEAATRADDYAAAEAEILEKRPDSVISFVGRTHGEGIPTIDYLEQPGKLVENMRDNLVAPINLADICLKHNIHYVYLGTGCIYTYTFPNQVFTEEDAPNFFGSSYSIVKGNTDTMMRRFSTTLQLRIRMPISAHPSPRNLIDKLVAYKNICSIPNSMTVLDDMWPIMDTMIEKKTTGTFNLVNPGVIEHAHILEMYKKNVDAAHTWNIVDYDTQMTFIKSHRSNNWLSSSKLEAYCAENGLALPHIGESVEKCIQSRK
jgi:dTDP-4-dehydrorhamnose reductase